MKEGQTEKGAVRGKGSMTEEEAGSVGEGEVNNESHVWKLKE